MDFSVRSLAKNYDVLSVLTALIASFLVIYSCTVSTPVLKGILLSFGIVFFISSSDFSKLKNKEVNDG